MTLVFIKSLREDTLDKFALNSTLQISILIFLYSITSYSSYTSAAYSFNKIDYTQGKSFYKCKSLKTKRSWNSTNIEKYWQVGQKTLQPV